MKTPILMLTVAVASAGALPLQAKTEAAEEQPIDLVICLDTSNSMDGLIDAAKQKLWDIVNELGTAKPRPHLRVGLYSYGTPAYGRQSGYVRKEIDLTDDLDAVYAKLTALRTSGGEEYVARVVRTGTTDQSWVDDKSALKIIVVAGNEGATQDPEYKTFDVCKEAITEGIIVNTIYCGSPSSREAQGWRDVALAADGQFASIDQDQGTIVISTPFDQKLVELGQSLNTTYVAYGKHAERGRFRQVAADRASVAASSSAGAGRMAAKASGQYRNYSWDLVDAREQKDFDLEQVKKEDLPAEMKEMTVVERKAYLDDMAKKRAGIQKEINDLNVRRQK